MGKCILDLEIDRRLSAVLSEIAAIRVAYFFGSRSAGRERGDSDLDLAVAYDPALDAWQREQVRRDVVAALTDALGSLGERADVVDLARADSAVCFAAIARGRCVLARSEEDRIEIEVRVARRYDDDAHLREMRSAAAAAAWRV